MNQITRLRTPRFLAEALVLARLAWKRAERETDVADEAELNGEPEEKVASLRTVGEAATDAAMSADEAVVTLPAADLRDVYIKLDYLQEFAGGFEHDYQTRLVRSVLADIERLMGPPESPSDFTSPPWAVEQGRAAQ